MELLSLGPAGHTFCSVQALWGPKSSEACQHMISGNLFSGSTLGWLELSGSSPQLPSHVGGIVHASLLDEAAADTAKLRASDSRGELGRAIILHLLLRRSESREPPQSSQRQSPFGSELNLESNHLLACHHPQWEHSHPPWT